MSDQEFDRFARTYDQDLARCLDGLGGRGSAAHFTRMKAAFIARRLTGERPAGILDFGCGQGHLTRLLAARFPEARVHGFDVSAQTIEALPPETRQAAFFTSDPAALDQAYDAVALAGVLHHIPPPDRTGEARRIANLLRPGGRVFIFEHNPANPLTRRIVDRCPFDRDVKLLYPEETRRLLQDQGFSTMRTTYVSFIPPWLPWLHGLEPLLGRIPLGAQYVVEGRLD